MQILVKFLLPIILISGLLYWLFVPSKSPVAPAPARSSEREEYRAQEMAQKYLEEREAKAGATPAPTPARERKQLQRRMGKGAPDSGADAEQVPDHIQEQVTREVVQKFEDMIYLETLPVEEEARYKYLSDSFMNSLFYLNEVAAKNTETSAENLGKAMKFLSLYARNGNADEIDDSIRIIRNEFPERFHEALREISEDDALIITDIVDNLDSEMNESGFSEGGEIPPNLEVPEELERPDITD